ncbi:CRACD-like protein isoform X2 [Ambystoma mexicanum]|uniref:CRACD-like protein isoform X2 n=1 Tax=Ambystoma mexicanum TaxID=8296 RepID=UPI0037E74A52
MATFYQCLRGDSSELHIRATGIMDTKPRDADVLAEDGSGKKKSKFKNFKKFFVKKKRKEALPSSEKSGLKPSQSTSDVTTHDSMHVDDDSEDETGSHMGGRALSHDSIFIPDIVQEPARTGRVFSQENVSDRIRTLQLKLQNAIVMGPPPLRIPSRRMEDAGASSEDDGLPRSPPEISLIQEVLSPSSATRLSDSYKRLSSLSLAGTGSEEEEQIPSGPSSRPLSPVSHLLPRPAGSRTVSPQRSDSHVSPSADFGSPPQFSSCLDNSAAKHRLSIKPRNQRIRKTRKPSKSPSESLNDLSCTPEEEEIDDGAWKEALQPLAWEGIASNQQATEDETQTVADVSGTLGLGTPLASSRGGADEMLSVTAVEKATPSEAAQITLEDLCGEKNELSCIVALGSEENEYTVQTDLSKDARGGKDLSRARSIFADNTQSSTVRTVKPERRPPSNIFSVNNASLTEDTSIATFVPSAAAERRMEVDAFAPAEVSHTEYVNSIKESSSAMSDLGREFLRRSSRKPSGHNLHANVSSFPVTQPTAPSSVKVGSTYSWREKNKSTQSRLSSRKESAQSASHSCTVPENRANGASELGTQRKFSVSSAWERPKTGSFNMKGSLSRENRLSVQFPLSKSDLPISVSEKPKGNVEEASEHQEKQCHTKKQDIPLDAEPRTEEKGTPVYVSQTQSTTAALNEPLVSPDCQSDAKERSPFQVKLRSTSLSLRYRDGSSPAEAKGAKRYSAEFKVEKGTYAPISKDEQTPIKRTDVSLSSVQNEHGKWKAKSSENLDAKPPLLRKPAVQNKTTSNTENQENVTTPPESKAESKETEKRSSFLKLSEENSDVCGDEFIETEKGMLSPVITAEAAKGADSQSEPTWMTRVKQKQWGLQEPQLNLEEKIQSPERRPEAVLQDKSKDSVEGASKQPAEATVNKSSSPATPAVPEESSQEGKGDPEVPRQRAHTVSHPISAMLPSLLAEKDEKAQTLRANPVGSERPSWMELAKKKSQAWNDMPQIIK